MRAVIIGSGDISDYEYIKGFLRSGDFIICADGGIRHAEAMGIEADILIGDFDSLPPSVKTNAEIIRYPAKKDLTDGELCVEYAAEKGADETLLIGMTGTRLDHTINNILLLFKCRGGRLIDGYNEIYALEGSLEIENRTGKTLSVIPVYGDLEGVVMRGFEYPLNGDTLYFGRTRGNSNVVTDKHAFISAERGRGIVIINNGE